MAITISTASRTRERRLRFKAWVEGLREKIEMDLNTSTGYYEVERPAREIRERRGEGGGSDERQQSCEEVLNDAELRKYRDGRALFNST